jgi:predicted Fe-Mo cluster-binding NifX family protein
MKIAVTASEPTMDAAADPRFGRCAYFVIVDTEQGNFEAVENVNAALGGGAGIQSAQLIADKFVATVLTGNCGPKAFETLSAAGVQVVTGCSGSVRDVIEMYRSGQVRPVSDANVADHFGSQPPTPERQTELKQSGVLPPVNDAHATDRGQDVRPGQGVNGREEMTDSGGMGTGLGMPQGQGMRRGRGMGRGRGARRTPWLGTGAREGNGTGTRKR